LESRPPRGAALRVFLPGLALLLATRAALAASDRFFPDGDEAVVGLMAKHLLERGEVSLFYWGQAYGLAILEAAAAAVAFAIAGISGAALKLAALALFVLGWIAFVAAARRLAGDRVASITGILLASAPAWFAFSMKAWGGFVTSFLLGAVALLVLAAPVDRPRRRRAAVAGGLAALALFSQAVGAVAFGLLFLADEARPRRRGEWAALVAGALVVGAALLAAARPGEAYWAPSLFRGFGGADVATAPPTSFARALAVMAGGCHFMNTALPSPPLARVAAAVTLLALVVLVANGAWRARQSRSFALEAACAASTLAVLAVALAMRPDRLMFRYLVPLIAPLALGVAVLVARAASARRAGRLAAALGAAVWVVAGVGAAWGMRSLPFNGWTMREERALPALVAMLEREHVRAVCTTHPTLQWLLMFESRERILARWTHPRDRRPEIPRAVDAALAAGETVALVAPARQAAAVASRLEHAGAAVAPEPRLVRDAFVVYLGVSAPQVEALGFAPADRGSSGRPAGP
jgi:hypothetical protein